ncbi:MAG TPA: heme o synthase [Verrucomicrobiae bacterium]|nr:heme o synthase [Verrucomicrobiae bacterium]
MATKPIAVVLDTTLSDYCPLAKPEVNFLIAITAAAAFCIGSPAGLSQFPWWLLTNTVLGTLLVASGAGALNQWIEHPFDARMRRTARRPIASGRIHPDHALLFGALLALTGVLCLTLAVGPAASLLALLTLSWYLLLYTPLKRRTPLCTLIGAFPGAMPVLIGYVATAGKLDRPAWLLFAILFLWQLPHFMAIAWMYREDYGRAGYRVLPEGGHRTLLVTCQTLVPLLALAPLSWLVAPLAAALPLAIGFLYYGVRFAIRRSTVDARRLLFASIIYLPALFGMAVLFRK